MPDCACGSSDGDDAAALAGDCGDVGTRPAPGGSAPKGTAAGVDGPMLPGGSDKPAGCGLAGTGTPPAAGGPHGAEKNSPASLARVARSGKPCGVLPPLRSRLDMAADLPPGRPKEGCSPSGGSERS